jgi:HEAT repeat protein
MTGGLGWVSGALALLSFLLVCTLAARRVALAHAERRRLSTEERLRPIALALVEGEPVNLPRLGAYESRALARVLARYARQVSGTALAHIGGFFEDHDHIAREVALLANRRAWRRASAAHSLGGMASKSAIPPLMEALGDSDPDVAAAAARSLGHLRALDAVEPLVYALVDGRLPRAVSAQALLSIGPDAVPRLRGLLAEAPVEVSAFAVDLIGLLGEASDSPQLVELLRDTSAEVRAHAARALGRLAAQDASDELRRALEDRIPFVRVNAAHALGAIRDAFAAPALARQARGDEFDPAEAAARALARVSPEVLVAVADEPGSGPHLAQAADLLQVQT